MTPEPPANLVKMLESLVPAAIYPSIPTWIICTASNQPVGHPMVANICSNPGEECTSACKTYIVCHPDDFDMAVRNVRATIKEFSDGI